MRKLQATGIIVLIVILYSCKGEYKETIPHQGLIGAYYGDSGFTNIKYPEILHNLDNYWDESTGHGSSWSGKYEGYLVSPLTAQVTFYLESNKEVVCRIGKAELTCGDGKESSDVTIRLNRGKKYPLSLSYSHEQGDPGTLKLSWSWPGKPKETVSPEVIGFSDEQALQWNYLPEPDPGKIDYNRFVRANGKHVVVFAEDGRFGGWPANGGIWSWGDEILVAFTNAAYKENPLHHSVDETLPSLSALARSTDGGESWEYEYPEHYPGDGRTLLSGREDIDFDHPDLVIKVNGNSFAVSYDRGKRFEGPFHFPTFGREKLTSRTDYVPISKDSCLFFLSTEEEEMVEARLQDWVFCSLTPDGGKTFEFLSWINEPRQARSVMPSTVRTSDHNLVTTLRRRYDQPFGDSLPKLSSNWIDAFASHDDGTTWKLLGKVADTDMGKHNGNPPSLCRMEDRRLVVTYGYRAIPYGIRAKVSEDNGRSWGEEIHLRDGAREFDMGYTRTVQRNDGKLVTVYYFTTAERKEQYIEACIWDPDDLIRPVWK
jgi:hypothetical protein